MNTRKGFHALLALAVAALAQSHATPAADAAGGQAAAPAAAAGPAAAAAGLRSAQPHGTITLVPDGALAGGRLLVRVVAYNPGDAPATLSAGSIDVRTGAGAAVRLVPLDKLIEEARASARPAQAGSGYQQNAYANNDNAVMRDSTGSVVGGAYGGAAAVSPVDQAALAARGAKDDPAVAQQVAALRAGILQELAVAPGKAAGAQFVTERLRFGRKEPRTLVVVLHFNGDEHRIELPVPPEGGR